MSEEKQKEIKTLKGWEESGKNWDDFCKPGELVDEDVYWYFLNILPPRNMGAGYLQVGEPYDSRLNPKTGKYMATYSTFVRGQEMIVGYCILNGKKWVMFEDKQCAAGEVKLTDGFKDKLIRWNSDKLIGMESISKEEID